MPERHITASPQTEIAGYFVVFTLVTVLFS